MEGEDDDYDAPTRRRGGAGRGRRGGRAAAAPRMTAFLPTSVEDLEAAYGADDSALTSTGNPDAIIPGSDMTERDFALLSVDEKRKQRRLIRNRLSAQLHRQRQRAHIDNLETQTAELSALVDVYRTTLRRVVSAAAVSARQFPSSEEAHSALSVVCSAIPSVLLRACGPQYNPELAITLDALAYRNPMLSLQAVLAAPIADLLSAALPVPPQSLHLAGVFIVKEDSREIAHAASAVASSAAALGGSSAPAQPHVAPPHAAARGAGRLPVVKYAPRATRSNALSAKIPPDGAAARDHRLVAAAGETGEEEAEADDGIWADTAGATASRREDDEASPRPCNEWKRQATSAPHPAAAGNSKRRRVAPLVDAAVTGQFDHRSQIVCAGAGSDEDPRRGLALLAGLSASSVEESAVAAHEGVFPPPASEAVSSSACANFPNADTAALAGLADSATAAATTDFDTGADAAPTTVGGAGDGRPLALSGATGLPFTAISHISSFGMAATAKPLATAPLTAGPPRDAVASASRSLLAFSAPPITFPLRVMPSFESGAFIREPQAPIVGDAPSASGRGSTYESYRVPSFDAAPGPGNALGGFIFPQRAGSFTALGRNDSMQLAVGAPGSRLHLTVSPRLTALLQAASTATSFGALPAPAVAAQPGEDTAGTAPQQQEKHTTRGFPALARQRTLQ